MVLASSQGLLHGSILGSKTYVHPYIISSIIRQLARQYNSAV